MMLKKRLGLDVQYEMVGSADMDQDTAMGLAMERMRKGGDMSWTDYPHYIKAQKDGVPLGIVSLMQIGDSVVYKNCFYALKNSPFKTISDLRGKRTSGGPRRSTGSACARSCTRTELTRRRTNSSATWFRCRRFCISERRAAQTAGCYYDVRAGVQRPEKKQSELR